jgi:hypothetical protein
MEELDPTLPPEPTGPNLPELVNQVRSLSLLAPNPIWSDTEKRAWCLAQIRGQSSLTRQRFKEKMKEKAVELPKSY